MKNTKKKLKTPITAGTVLGGIGKYAVIIFILVISLYPLLWVFINSFKDNNSIGGLGLPERWVFDGYTSIFAGRINIAQYFFNSIVVTVVSVLISVAIVAMSAYISARMKFKGKGLITAMFATTLFIPPISISFPIYRIVTSLDMKNTLLSVIFVYAGLGIAVTFFIIRSYFLTIPKAMEEAAQIDGCGYASTFFRIIVPIARPGLITAAILAFLNNWNEFYFASILLTQKDKMTIPALLGVFQTAYSTNYNGMFSAIIVSVVPTIIIFCIASEAFIKSLTAGAVKG